MYYLNYYLSTKIYENLVIFLLFLQLSQKNTTVPFGAMMSVKQREEIKSVGLKLNRI